MNFEDMALAPYLLPALAKMHVTQPTPIQRETIPAALAGKDLLGIAQTGSGKTLAYALPILTQLEKNPKARALILLPSRETADQVHRVFNELSSEISIALAVSGIPDKLQRSQLKKIPRLIVATPGRLVEHLRENKLLLQGLATLVLDEADRMLSLGFETQLKFILSTLRGERQTLMFAASSGSWAGPVAETFLRPDALTIKATGAGKPVQTLRQKVLFLAPGQKENRLRDELRTMKGGVIVFADSQERCASLGRFLEHHGFDSSFMHGDMNPGHRNRVLREFREEKVQILITTDLLARGLDVPHVKHVISYDLPYKAEDYLHRIGRTARAEREGFALTFVTAADGNTYRKMKPYLEGAEEETISTGFKFGRE